MVLKNTMVVCPPYHVATYSLSSKEILLPLGLNCKKLECIEFWSLHHFQFDVQAFDDFFEKRQKTLKRLRIHHHKPLNENLFQNLNLCQNIEQLVLESRFMNDEGFYSIKQLPGLRTLNIENVPREILKIADWPNLERIWINGPFEIEDYREEKFNDACIQRLIYNSKNLKSIHFDDPKQCDISNEFLFETFKKTKIFISFGYGEFDYFDFKNQIKESVRQLNMEKYFCKQDINLYDKYQDMKVNFADWLKKGSSWFDCINLDMDTSNSFMNKSTL